MDKMPDDVWAVHDMIVQAHVAEIAALKLSCEAMQIANKLWEDSAAKMRAERDLLAREFAEHLDDPGGDITDEHLSAVKLARRSVRGGDRLK